LRWATVFVVAVDETFVVEGFGVLAGAAAFATPAWADLQTALLAFPGFEQS